MQNPIEIRFDMTDLERQLNRYSRNLRNINMYVVGEIIRSAMEEVIETEGISGTQGKWEPFSPETLKRHPHRIGGTLLVDSGKLSDFQIDVFSEDVSVFSPADYSEFFVTGTRNMPMRDPTAINWNGVLDDVIDYLSEEVI